MSSYVSSVVKGQTAQQTPNTVEEPDAFNKMDFSEFINLLVVEMQNQDPMNPMENSEILQQVSQIKAIASNDKLTSTLTSLQMQQDMAAGGVLLNQTITGLNDDSKMITGVVDRVSIADGKVKLHVGDNTVSLKNVSSMNGVSGDTQLELDLETGNAILNHTITGLDSNGTSVSGKVDKILVDGNSVKLQIGTDTVNQKTVALNKLTQIDGLDSDALIEQYRESGNSLVNQTVTGLNAEGKLIVGKVDKISLVDGKVQLQVGDHAIKLTNVKEIDATTTTTGS